MMRIARIYYPVTVLGPGNRIGIWTAGCNRNCKGCISPELKKSENGIEMSADEIIRLIEKVNYKIDGITISGGEPFLCPNDLLELVIALERITEDIIVFTGYEYLELIQHGESKRILQHISVLIDGMYDDTMPAKNGLKGSTNQQIIVLKPFEKYRDLETCNHEIQNVIYKNKLLSIGIPSGANL